VKPPKILLGVTVDISIGLMNGFPQYLAKHGWDVHVVSAPGPALDQLRANAGITAHALPMKRNVSPFADLRSLLRWVRLLVRVRPDVVSVGTPKAALLGGLAGLLTRVPVRIYHLRGLRFETTSSLQRRLLVAAEHLTIAASHIVLAVSSSLRDQLIDLSMVTGHKIVVLGRGSSNGVDLELFDRRAFAERDLITLRNDLGLHHGVPVIGFVGRLTADKGLEVLARACSVMTFKNVDYQLLIVGSIDDESGQAGLSLLGRVGRPPIVTGHVRQTNIYFQLMDVLCLPTLREGFPNVILEAGASSLASVSTDATGAVDSIIHGETGLTVPSRDSDALAAALIDLLTNEAKRLKMGENARKFVSKSFDRVAVWASLEGFFKAQRASPGNGARR
jgi:glycosyltransferase involved in cell wall biosynthesis